MADHKFRLVEYVATIGIDENVCETIKQMEGDLSTIKEVALEGCVLSRFPQEDHQDFPFSSGIVNFCLPNGWYIETRPKRPLFYSVVLTDVDGVYSYAAYIVWNQFIGRNIDNDIYVPRCICVVSRLPYFDLFKECLLTIFDGLWMQDRLETSKDKYLTEKVVSALISSPEIFEPGMEPYRLSLYDKYYVNVQPPLTTQFNSTGDDVFFLAKHLGVHNLIRLYNALVLDNKILFVSSSYNFLFKACNGLVSLLYPMKFNYVYIPLLPKSLTDIVNAPTPFMIGMHASSFKSFCAGSLPNDVVVINLDTGSVKINADHSVPSFPENLTNFLEVGLSNILFSELVTPDELFCEPKHMSDEHKDKKIKAYFLILLVQIFEGYLSCTNVVRVHPKILIKFQKDQFVFRRNLCDCQFISKLLDTMVFNQFISERGVPYRKCDIFDDLIMKYNNEVACTKDQVSLIAYINTACSAFMENEGMDEETGNTNKKRSVLPSIRLCDENSFSAINVREIETNQITFSADEPDPSDLKYSTNVLAKMARSSSFIPLDINSYRFGLSFCISKIDSQIVKEFVRYLFCGESPRALQMIKKVQSLGNQPGIRVLLCNELSAQVKQNRVQLDCEQFRILSDVINSYLDNENDDYCFTMSSLVVELANSFYKKTKENMMYIFTQLHNHKAWGFLPFWESLFYVNAQSQLNDLFLHDKTLASIQTVFDEKQYAGYYLNEREGNFSSRNVSPPPVDANSELVFHSSYHEISRIAPVIVDQLIKKESLSAEHLELVEKLEDDILFSTISLFISQILYMNMHMKEASKYLRCLKVNSSTGNKLEANERSHTATQSSGSGECHKTIARSDTLSRNVDVLSSYKAIFDLIQRFISNVFVTLDFKYEASNQIYSRMREIIQFHCESLDRIYQEKELQLKDIGNIVKTPLRIPGETVNAVFSCVMLPDGMVNAIKQPRHNSPAILPAIGVVYATQYRLFFFGYPMNRYTSNCVVCRSVPFGLIRSFKLAESGYFPTFYQKLVSVSQPVLIQLKTGGKVVLGLLSENGTEKIDLFSKLLSKRYSRLLTKLNQNELVASAEGAIDSVSLAPGFVAGDAGEKGDTMSMSYMSAKMIPPSRKDSLISNVDYDSVSVFEGSGSGGGGEVENPQSKVSKVGFFKKSMKMKLKGLKSTASKKIKSATNNFEIGIGSLGHKSKLKAKQKVQTTDFQAIYGQLFSSGVAPTEKSVTNKVTEKSLYLIDYGQRMQILVFNINLASTIFSKVDWRLTLMNTNKLIPTLPTVFPVCFQISDDTILRLTKLFKSKRIPVLSWTRFRPPPTSVTTAPTSEQFSYYPGAMLRCASVLKSLNVFGIRNPIQNSPSKQGLNSGLSELDNYFITLAGLSSKVKVMQTHVPRQKSVESSKNSSKDEMYLDILDRLKRPHMLFLTDTQEAYDVNDVSCHFSDLYVFGDKSFNKGVSDDKKLTIFNVEMPEASQIESAFLKLTKSLSPNRPEPVTQSSYMTLISKSKWFTYIKKLLELSTNFVFSIDYGEAFSIAGFGDGSETSAQLSSLVQIMLDPFYRTIDGFQTLVEKEWLAFRHNFVQRNGLSNASQSVFYPIFLQFLDCVHQLLLQFPNAFEFNDYFLKFLAYHHISNKFSTFITCSTDSFVNEATQEVSEISAELFSAKSTDELASTTTNTLKSIESIDTAETTNKMSDSNEMTNTIDEEPEGEVTAPPSESDAPQSHESVDHETPASVVPSTVTTRSSLCSLANEDDCFVKETIWSYINRYREKIPIFYNTQFIQGMNSVLYPSYHLALIDLWEYYYEVPQLLTPSNYELEYIDTDLFVDNNAVFPYEYCCENYVPGYSSRPSATAMGSTVEAEGEKKNITTDNHDQFTFYSGASYLGYVIETPLVVDLFNHTVNTHLKANPDYTKLSSVFNFANIYTSDKLPHTVNVGTPDERQIYQLLYCNYFSIINTKRFFISLVSKDKSFYSKTNLTDSDHYFCQITHDFVEAPPSEHLPCMYCSKILSGKCNYYTCQKCHLNIHIKCSKQISQVCSMGSNPPPNPDSNANTPDTHTLKVKSQAKRYQSLFRHKDKSISNASSIDTAEHTENPNEHRRSFMLRTTDDSCHRWSAVSSTSEAGELSYTPSVGSNHQHQGYLYSGSEQSAGSKNYYVIDSKDQRLLVYDKKPSLDNSVLLDDYHFSDIERYTIIELDSECEQGSNATSANKKPSRASLLTTTDQQQRFCIYLEIKINFLKDPLQLRGRTDEDTRRWHTWLCKNIQNY